MMNCIKMLLGGVLLMVVPIFAGSVSPAKTAIDLNNPHKGFMLWGTDYSDGVPDNYYGATVFHIYVPWREVEISDEVYDWDGFESRHLQPILNDYSNATFVLRPVADYPDGNNSGITIFYGGVDVNRDFPIFLAEAPLNIATSSYSSCDGDGPGVTPDWNDANMITRMVEFVVAFGARYDGDPRITAIQTGLLGLWGEWHQSGCESNAPGNAVKSAVRDAYSVAFISTPVQTRYPRDPDAVGVEFGFHEDYFPSFTGADIYGFPDADDSGDWSMYYCFQNVTPASSNNWLSNPVSGESPLNSQKQAWTNDFDDIMTVLHDYHFSFLGPAGGHETNGNQAKFSEMKRMLGYNFHIERCDWPDVIVLGVPFDVELVMTNSGAAPCYHDFPVELALCAADGTPVWTNRFAFDLRNVIPGGLYTNIESFVVNYVPAGDWSLRIGVINPRFGRPGVRLQSAGEDSNLRYEVGTVRVNRYLPSQYTHISHLDTDITQLTEGAINRAKAKLHIAYGHTSHGSQLTNGMDGLVDFANGGGKWLAFTNDIFAWSHGGTGGTLDLHDYAMGGDVGYYPQWYNNTVNYLNDPSHSNVNVVIWSWCGQMPGKYSDGTLTNQYLLPMSQLETNYPDVIFVYMTGHVDIWNDANHKAACEVIRNYCSENNKVLYDFADIEHYNPDGTFFEYVGDNCDYYSGAGTGKQGNWGTEWQDSHTTNVDWYICGSAHSEPINANMKAYAAWALWCRLAADMDMDGISDEWEEQYGGIHCFLGGSHDHDGDGMSDIEEYWSNTNPTNMASVFAITAISNGEPVSVSFKSSTNRLYSLQYRESINSGQWNGVSGQTNVVGTGNILVFTNTPALTNQCFYRLNVYQL